MSKPIRSVIIASSTPRQDEILLGDEWMALRTPTKSERATFSIPKNCVAQAFVLRSCEGPPQVVVVWQGVRKPIFHDFTTRGALPALTSRYGLSFPQAKSVLALQALNKLAPEAIQRLADQRPVQGHCVGCNCIWGSADAERNAA